MTADRNHLHFLLRSSVLVIISLILWWFFLLNPLLFLLKGSMNICGSVIYRSNIQQFLTETDSGEWRFQVLSGREMSKVTPWPGFPKEAKLSAIDLQPSIFYLFTFGIPVFWAIVLATSGIRRSLRPILLGTIAMVAIETALALAFVEIAASRAAAGISDSRDEFSKWFELFEYKIVIMVGPYMTPFIVAVALHRELRWQIFRFGNPALPLQRDNEESGGRKADRSFATRKGRGRTSKMARHN
jgi:hypothetical protein